MTAPSRASLLARLATRRDWPVVIVGGGINGVATFRDLSLQGVDCLLIDRGDFCAGASAAPSRMIHGGLKYLETGEFRLVAEATLERNRLLRNAAHLVRPLETFVPLRSRLGGIVPAIRRFIGQAAKSDDRGSWIVKLGFALYDHLGRHERTLPRYRMLGNDAAHSEMPDLSPAITAAGIYWDAWITQPERLAVEMALDGERVNAGSLALNHVTMDGGAAGELVLRDVIGGQVFTVRPGLVVNAAGAWIDGANHAIGVASHHIGGTKGSHILLDHAEMHDRLAGRMIYFGRADGRICLAYPFLDKVLVGSTDIRAADPDRVRCDDAEIEYMLAAMTEIFPGLPIGRDRIVYTYCGVRPLPASDATDPGKVSRDHSIPIHEPTPDRPFAVLCLVGGKWTTHRAFGAAAADRVLERVGKTRGRDTAALAVGGGTDFPADPDAHARKLAERHGIAPERATDLLFRYGTRTEAFLASLDRVNTPDRPLRHLAGYGEREIAWLLAAERAATLADLVLRRTTIAITGRASLPALEELAGLAAPTLGWNDARRTAELKATLTELSRRHRVVPTAKGQKLAS